MGSTTIPLTFNLRDDAAGDWRIVEKAGSCSLVLTAGTRSLSQVDCQHRLGHLADVDVELPFMCFIGLSARDEMVVFGTINGKAKGLSNSLLDFHDAQLCADLAAERPELLVALHLKNEPSSPWYNRLDLGGDRVSGLDRCASLRTMQKASRILVRRLRPRPAEEIARLSREFWIAVATVMPEAFSKPRRSLVTKGVGVYALSEIAADIVGEAGDDRKMDARSFACALSEFIVDFDWSSSGPLSGLGGGGGVKRAVEILSASRRRPALRLAHG